MTYIAPNGVQINVLRNTAGSTNFAPPVPPRNSVPRQPFFTLESIGTVHVKDATITFGDAPGRERPAPSFALSGLNAKITSIDPQAADWAKTLDIVTDLRDAKLTTLLLSEPVDFHTGEFTFKKPAPDTAFARPPPAV